MKTTFRLLLVMLLGVTISSTSCTKTDDEVKNDPETATLATVTTTDVTDAQTTTLTSGGNITDDGKADITARGVCYSRTEANPTLESNEGFTSDGTGAGSFISKPKNLLNGNKYYIRAYATNLKGTAYGAVKEGTTIQ